MASGGQDEDEFAITADGEVAFAVSAEADEGGGTVIVSADDGGGTVIVSWQDYSAFAEEHPDVERLEIDPRGANEHAVEKLAEAASDSGHDVDFSEYEQ